MKEKIERITKVIDQFGHEEMGNRLSQFAWLSFKNIILTELNKEGKDVPDPGEHISES